MDKLTSIVIVFAGLAILYLVYFTVSYVNTQKKTEKFKDSDEEPEHFSEPPDSYSLGIKVLTFVDEAQKDNAFTKDQRSDIVKELFGQMNDLKKLDEDGIKEKVAEVVKKVVAVKPPTPPPAEVPSKTPEKFDDSVKNVAKQDDVTELREHLSKALSIVDRLKPTYPTVSSPPPSIEGFENAVKFASFM